jgi:FixJ family two-component response regulator
MFRGGGFFSGLASHIGGIFAGRPKGEQQEIAALLNISERTVKFHVSSILKKTGKGFRGDLLEIKV